MLNIFCGARLQILGILLKIPTHILMFLNGLSARREGIVRNFFRHLPTELHTRA